MIFVVTIVLFLLSAFIGEGGKALPPEVNRVGFGNSFGTFMFDDRASFLSRPYLQSMLDFEFRDYLDMGQDGVVLSKLKQWNARDKKQTETQAENAFVQVFFVDLWGNGLSGAGHEDNHTLFPRYAVEGGSGSSNKQVENAIAVLRQIGMPRAQINERSALTLLALLDLRKRDDWANCKNPLVGVTPIMGWMERTYQK